MGRTDGECNGGKGQADACAQKVGECDQPVVGGAQDCLHSARRDRSAIKLGREITVTYKTIIITHVFPPLPHSCPPRVPVVNKTTHTTPSCHGLGGFFASSECRLKR
ncbi:unnamed protein product [Protopolystoma xenopodis]|uniref:Uncharacterized protein n=1 Tax=Protopolystoma xenopodis TaxID=117903 RepID=A0A3S5B2K1_9PLAT|nr:unnamed protein product [Protopolystoma xenopodis]